MFEIARILYMLGLTFSIDQEPEHNHVRIELPKATMEQALEACEALDHLNYFGMHYYMVLENDQFYCLTFTQEDSTP